MSALRSPVFGSVVVRTKMTREPSGDNCGSVTRMAAMRSSIVIARPDLRGFDCAVNRKQDRQRDRGRTRASTTSGADGRLASLAREWMTSIATSASPKKIATHRWRRKRVGLSRASPANVRQRNPDDHPNEVLDSPEAKAGILHRRAEVAESRMRERAEEHIQDEAEQHLQVERRNEPEAGAIVGRRPRACDSRRAGRRAHERGDAREEHSHRSQE